MAMQITDIPRNDLEAAVAFYRGQGGRITADDWRVLWKLQDDPEAFEALSEDWNVERVDME